MKDLMEKISDGLSSAEEAYLGRSDDEKIAFVRRLALMQDLADVLAVYEDCLGDDVSWVLAETEDPLEFLCDRIGGKIDRQDYQKMLLQMVEEATS